MSQKDKIKLAVAVVVLLAAGLLIYFNVRTPKPDAPPAGPASPEVTPATADKPPPPKGPERGVYKGR